MTRNIPRRHLGLAILCSALFVLAFPIMTHFVSGGELFGAFMIIPLTLIAWNYGQRTGQIAALVGIGFTEAIFSPEYFLVHHNDLSPYWIMMVTSPAMVFLYVGLVVGKLGDTLMELRRALDAKKQVEEALSNAMNTARQYVDIAGVILLVLDRNARIMLLNKKGHSVLGYSGQEFIGRDYVTSFVPQRFREEMKHVLERVMNGESAVEYYENTVITRQGEERLIAWHNALLKDDEDNVIGSLSSGEDITERRESERALEASYAHLNGVLNALPDVMYEVDRRGVIYKIRAARPYQPLFPKLFSQNTKRLEEALPADAAKPIMDSIARAAENGHYKTAAIEFTNNGETRWYELSIAAIGDHYLDDCHFVVLASNVSDRMRLEQQLIQSQKMEAVGRLAGGIAHDFNNILMVIIGFCDVIRAKEGNRQEVLKYMTTIRDSADRAASLTKQLLAFSRKQILSAKVVDADALIKDSKEMLAKMIGEDISIIHESSGEANYVKVDPGQLQQVIMNLAVNARDAMPVGGRLTLKVRSVEIAADDAERPTEMIPGEYVLIQVNDTGAGMEKETLSHLFEPFFTTKQLGKGTGLGLSIVYGVVKQSEGYVYVTSKLGSGTTFSVYLPRVLGESEIPKGNTEEEHKGTETILVVEDEEGVRNLISQQLTGYGYSVLEAKNGAEALIICHGHKDKIHLLLTDVVLPGVRGGKVAEAFRATNPKGRVIYMTGYTDTNDFAESARRENATILQKPFTLADLATSIRQVIDESQTGR